MTQEARGGGKHPAVWQGVCRNLRTVRTLLIGQRMVIPLWRGIIAIGIVVHSQINAIANDSFGYIDVYYRNAVTVRLWDYPTVVDAVEGLQPINCENCGWAVAPRDVVAFSHVSYSTPPPCTSTITQLGNALHRALLIAQGNQAYMRAYGIAGGVELALEIARRQCSHDGSSRASVSAGGGREMSITFSLSKRTLVTVGGAAAYGMAYGGWGEPIGGIIGSGGTFYGHIDLSLVYPNGDTESLRRLDFNIVDPGRLEYFEEVFVLDPGTYRVQFWGYGYQEVIAWGHPDDRTTDSSSSAAGMAFGNTLAMFVIRHPFRIPEGYNAYQVLRTDIDGNGCIDDGDLLNVISNYGRQQVYINWQALDDGRIDEDDVIVDLEAALYDVNQDGVVDDGDILHILGLFGHCYIE